MADAIATPRLKLVPVVVGDAARLGAMAGCADPCGSSSAKAIATAIADSLDDGSITAFWRIATEGADCIGLIGLTPPATASLALRAIGWRSLELVVLLDERFRGRGLASEAVAAVAQYAGCDGVTFALVASIAEGDERARRLMARCSFTELGRVPDPACPLVIYERVV